MPATTANATNRQTWIDAQNQRHFFTNLASTVWFGPLILPVCMALMWGKVDMHGLYLWSVLGVVLALSRALLLHHVNSKLLQLPDGELLAAVARLRWLWCLVPLHWGCSTFLFYGALSPTGEFLMLSVLVGIASVATNSYPSDIKATLWFLRSALIGPMLVWTLSMLGLFETNHSLLENAALACFATLYYVACVNAARRNHAFLSNALGLQFDNARLIDSLDLQTRETQDAMASRSRLLAGAAHDLRQPVHALSLFADWLSKEPQMAQEISPKIVRSAQAVHRLFDGMFELTKLDQEPPLEPWTSLDLRTELTVAAAQYEAMARERGLRVRVHCKAGVCVCIGPLTLRRLVGNLLDNAIKYTDNGGVLLSARNRSGRWRVEVWDTGVGIEADEIEPIFKEFYRVKRHEGTQDSFGLGLSIVKRMATRINAQVSVQSRVGVGSRFVLTLPTLEEQLKLQPLPTDAQNAAARI